MTVEQILKLIDAGYTKDDISKLTADVSRETVEQTVQVEPVEDKTDKSNNANDLLAQIASLTDTVNALKQSQQQSNIINKTVETHTETTKDILAKLINPHYQEGNK